MFGRVVGGELKARRGLEESELNHRRLVEGFPESIVVHSGGTFVFANPAAAELFGAGRPEDLLGGSWIERVHPGDRAVARSRVAHTQENGEPVDPLEMKFVRLDGSVVAVEALAMPITYGGKPGTLSVARDVTGRREAEKALARTEARFRAIFEQGAIGISILSPEKVFLGANPAYRRMLGYGEAELLGKSLADVTHPDDVPAYVDLHEKLFAGKINGYQRE